jgi:citrate synthase
VSKTASELSEKELEAVLYFGALPALLAVLTTGVAPEKPAQRESFSATLLRHLMADPLRVEDQRQVTAFEALMVGLQVGYSYLSPSVTLPRLAAGTRASLPLCLISGLTGSGPAHVGACDQAMELLVRMERCEAGADDVQAIQRAVEGWSKEYGRVPGFGNPLFPQDPRIERLWTCLKPIQTPQGPLQRFEALCRFMQERYGISPNIDGLSAAAFLELSLPAGRGTALFLCIRTAGMIAHIFDKLRRPTFGVTSATARGFFHKLPAGWL